MFSVKTIQRYIVDSFINSLFDVLRRKLGLLSTVAFFPRACTHGKVYILLTFPNGITNGIKDNIQPYV